jgi:hypothetical protein
MDLIIDFTIIKQPVAPNDILHKQNGKKEYQVPYDETTTLYYKSHRTGKTDPITFDEMNDRNAFKFSSMWNPMTGVRTTDDPFGSIYFNPINLLNHFYNCRLNGLWIGESDENDEMYEGYYGDGVGAGEDFEIIGRGIYPERYIFRLPIPNCYLPPNNNMSLITMGPKLTDSEICSIDQIITNHWYDHLLYDKIYKRIGSLHRLKRTYDIAISKNPTTADLKFLKNGNIGTKDQKKNLGQSINRLAVNILKRM